MNKILAISGSLRASSANTALLRAAQQVAPAKMQINIFEGLDELPHFSPDRDGAQAPPAILAFRKQLQDADGVIICTPEYAFGMPGVLKNALDWTVSSGELVNKPMVTISASPLYSGADKAHASLLLVMTALSAHIPEGGSLTLPAIKSKMDEQGVLTDTNTLSQLQQLLQALENILTA